MRGLKNSEERGDPGQIQPNSDGTHGGDGGDNAARSFAVAGGHVVVHAIGGTDEPVQDQKDEQEQ